MTTNTDGPIYPPGTPEYDTYLAALRVELDLFVRGVPPYDTAEPDPTAAEARAWNRLAGFGL